MLSCWKKESGRQDLNLRPFGPPARVDKRIPPRGVELLLKHTGLRRICKQRGTESGTVVEDSRLLEMLESLSSLTDDEREMLTELLEKMG